MSNVKKSSRPLSITLSFSSVFLPLEMVATVMTHRLARQISPAQKFLWRWIDARVTNARWSGTRGDPTALIHEAEDKGFETRFVRVRGNATTHQVDFDRYRVDARCAMFLPKISAKDAIWVPAYALIDFYWLAGAEQPKPAHIRYEFQAGGSWPATAAEIYKK